MYLAILVNFGDVRERYLDGTKSSSVAAASPSMTWSHSQLGLALPIPDRDWPKRVLVGRHLLPRRAQPPLEASSRLSYAMCPCARPFKTRNTTPPNTPQNRDILCSRLVSTCPAPAYQQL